VFENFFDFVDQPLNQEITSVDEFLAMVSGKTFCNGMFRFFEPDEIEKWNGIVTEYYSDYLDNIEVVCYDWLGRVFALSKFTDTIIFFEPGTGEVYNTDETFEDFFELTIEEYTNDCFASDFFELWYEYTDEYQLSRNECASYIVPLFLNGSDTVENLEVCDMEVHWEIMRAAHNND
jgi:hypothetical protein